MQMLVYDSEALWRSGASGRVGKFSAQRWMTPGDGGRRAGTQEGNREVTSKEMRETRGVLSRGPGRDFW